MHHPLPQSIINRPLHLIHRPLTASDAGASKPASADASSPGLPQLSLGTQPAPDPKLASLSHTPQAPQPAPPPEAQLIEANHSRIITGIRAELLPHGGSMQIRLDPPELGVMQVQISMRDGVVTAAFHTTNDQATRMLSHSLDQLKQSLELQGVTVAKLQVQQSPREHQTPDRQDQSGGQQQHQPEDSTAHHEQQRREMLQRMWRRLRDGADPLDLVA